MRLSEQQSDFMWMVRDLQNFAEPLCKGFGVYIKVTDWYRTVEQQKKYVVEGVSWKMDSKHLVGLAVDFVVMKKGQPNYDHVLYKLMGIFWESIGGVWGGNWKKHKDKPHYEYNETLRAAYKG